MASYSVQSERYVEKQGFDYVTPPEIAGIPEAAAEYGRIMDECAKSYETLTSLLKEKHERELVKGADSRASMYEHDRFRLESGLFGPVTYTVI